MKILLYPILLFYSFTSFANGFFCDDNAVYGSSGIKIEGVDPSTISSCLTMASKTGFLCTDHGVYTSGGKKIDGITTDNIALCLTQVAGNDN